VRCGILLGAEPLLRGLYDRAPIQLERCRGVSVIGGDECCVHFGWEEDRRRAITSCRLCSNILRSLEGGSRGTLL
jgi:hypothetical protein